MRGEADMGLGLFVKAASGLVREPLCRFRLLCISPPGTSPPGLNGTRSWRSLVDLKLLSLPADNPIQALIESHLHRPQLRPGERLRMNFLGTLIAMVEAGVGHAVVPSIVLAECLRHGLAISWLVEPVVHLDLYGVTRRGAMAKPPMVDFDRVLKAAARQLEQEGAMPIPPRS